MNEELEQRLRDRLDRIAADVPVAPPDPAVLGVSGDRPRWGRPVMLAAAALVAVIAVATQLVGTDEDKPVAVGDPAPMDCPVATIEGTLDSEDGAIIARGSTDDGRPWKVKVRRVDDGSIVHEVVFDDESVFSVVRDGPARADLVNRGRLDWSFVHALGQGFLVVELPPEAVAVRADRDLVACAGGTDLGIPVRYAALAVANEVLTVEALGVDGSVVATGTAVDHEAIAPDGQDTVSYGFGVALDRTRVHLPLGGQALPDTLRDIDAMSGVAEDGTRWRFVVLGSTADIAFGIEVGGADPRSHVSTPDIGDQLAEDVLAWRFLRDGDHRWIYGETPRGALEVELWFSDGSTVLIDVAGVSDHPWRYFAFDFAGIPDDVAVTEARALADDGQVLVELSAEQVSQLQSGTGDVSETTIAVKAIYGLE